MALLTNSHYFQNICTSVYVGSHSSCMFDVGIKNTAKVQCDVYGLFSPSLNVLFTKLNLSYLRWPCNLHFEIISLLEFTIMNLDTDTFHK